jgi:hypothetical protein
MIEKDCKHFYRIFLDRELERTGYLSFYCQYCLKLFKVKKAYVEENGFISIKENKRKKKENNMIKLEKGVNKNARK